MGLRVRKKKNQSGSISVQIVDRTNRGYKVVETLGCSDDETEIDKLHQKAILRINDLSQNLFSKSLDETSEKLLLKKLLSKLTTQDFIPIGDELIFGKIFNNIGCNNLFNNVKSIRKQEDKNFLFKSLVISRLLYPGSKLELINYLSYFKNIDITSDKIYRFLDTLYQDEIKSRIETCVFEHTKKVMNGEIIVTFYDVTTLYFEASSEDDLRKVGFSKDGKFTKPQIILGLLTSLEGYPLGFEIHEGNCYEGKTFIPMLEKFQKKFNIEKPIVVADSGLLSKANILELEKLNYRYILGARIKSSSSEIKNKIVSLNLNDEKNIETIYFSKNQKMIVSYSQQRAKKDRYTRTKNYEKLKIKIKSGNLTKAHLNNKGYNKYLVLSDSQTTISIDEDKYNYDSSFDGLKGFVTNDFSLNPTQIIEHYTNLWHIERAFRISKTDLKIRPIYHRLEHRIYSHILISFVAYTVYKEFDRKLKINNISIKRKNAIGFIKSMYGIVHDNEISLLELSPEQEQIYKLFY